MSKRLFKKRSLKKALSKNYDDIDFIRCFIALDKGELDVPISSFYKRPAYQYTKAEVGGIR